MTDEQLYSRMEPGNYSRPELERHAQTVLSIVLAALLTWVGMTLVQSIKVQTRLEERVQNLTMIVEKLEAKINGSQFVARFEMQEAFARMEEKGTETRTRVIRLERRFHSHKTPNSSESTSEFP